MRHVIPNNIPIFPSREDHRSAFSYWHACNNWVYDFAPVFVVGGLDGIRIGLNILQDETTPTVIGKYFVVHAWIDDDVREIRAIEDDRGYARVFDEADAIAVKEAIVKIKESIAISIPEIVYEDIVTGVTTHA